MVAITLVIATKGPLRGRTPKSRQPGLLYTGPFPTSESEMPTPYPRTIGGIQTYCQYKNGGPIFAESLGNLTA